MNYTGWNPQDEERDYAEYSGLCKKGLLRGHVLEWSDVKSQIIDEAQNAFTTPIARAVMDLHQFNKSTYERYHFGRQETNDCSSWATCNGFDLTQVGQAYRGIETEVFRTFKPWVYAVGKNLAGQTSDNGNRILNETGFPTQPLP